MSNMENIPRFTCSACNCGFSLFEPLKHHYKTDWHRYNLKRRVVPLPPVSIEEFAKRLNHQKELQELSNAGKTNGFCEVCKKTFSTNNSLLDHLQSKKHKENEKKYVKREPTLKVEQKIKEDEDVEELDSDEWEDEAQNPIDDNNCIFCLNHSRNFFKNLEHMTTAHSFFIPDIEYCTDVEGLMKYLGEKISDGFMCLWCNEKGRTFHTAEAARMHMISKGHCKMLHEGIALAEYTDFYDYSTSYPDAEKEVNINEEIEVPELESSEYQLVLPSGVTVGHRSLMRYYKQSINPNSAVVVAKSNKKLHKVLATYRSLGWTETQQAAAAKKARDIHFMKRMQSKYFLKLGRKLTNFNPILDNKLIISTIAEM